MVDKSVERFKKRRYGRLISRMDAEDEGKWITTENGHKVHLNEAGEPDKGNPYVVRQMSTNGFAATMKWSKKGLDPHRERPKGCYKSLSDIQLGCCQAAESIMLNYPVEGSCCISEDGTIVFSKIGDSGSVTFTDDEVKKMAGNVLTHSHPESGGTFSTADISLFYKGKLKAIRAISPEGVYTLERANASDDDVIGFIAAVDSTWNNIKDLFKVHREKLENDFSANKITQVEYRTLQMALMDACNEAANEAFKIIAPKCNLVYHFEAGR